MRIAARSIVLVDGARCRRVGRVYARGCIVAATVNLHLVVVVLVLGVGKGVQTVGGVGAVAAVYARMVEQQQTVVEVAAGVVVNVATATGLLTRDEVVGADIVGIFRPIGVALVCVDSTCRNIDGATDVRVCSIELHNQSLVAERRRCRGTDVQRLQVVAVGEGKTNDKGEKEPMGVNVGDIVLYAKYAGTEVKMDGVEYKILSIKDALAIVE